jgi:hypothetical protein
MLLYKVVHWYNELNENVKQEMNFESFRRQCTEFVEIKFEYDSKLNVNYVIKNECNLIEIFTILLL